VPFSVLLASVLTFERIVYTKVVPTTYVSVWESTVTKDQTQTVVETKSKTGGFLPTFRFTTRTD
jgi:hypothetical protein